MWRRSFALGCACALTAPAWARSCRDALCVTLAPLVGRALARARRDFDDLAHAALAEAPDDRIAFVNRAVNDWVVAADDLELGAVDVWLTPLETFARRRGDCEDIAIAKFFVLLAAGVDATAVRLLYARWRDRTRPALTAAHLVALARDPFEDPLVLDNLIPMALPTSCRDDLEPVFSFDRAQLWAGVGGPCRGRAPERLHAWGRLLGRMATQH